MVEYYHFSWVLLWKIRILTFWYGQPFHADWKKILKGRQGLDHIGMIHAPNFIFLCFASEDNFLGHCHQARLLFSTTTITYQKHRFWCLQGSMTLIYSQIFFNPFVVEWWNVFKEKYSISINITKSYRYSQKLCKS